MQCTRHFDRDFFRVFCFPFLHLFSRSLVFSRRSRAAGSAGERGRGEAGDVSLMRCPCSPFFFSSVHFDLLYVLRLVLWSTAAPPPRPPARAAQAFLTV